MQPQKSKKSKEKSLLDRLRERHPVELGMELKGYVSNYKLEGTKDKKILVSSTDGEFLGSAKTIKEALKIIADTERKAIDDYDVTKIQTTYVYTEDEVETKIREEAMPKRFPKAGIIMHGRRFYIIKKQPNGKSSGKVFCLYNFDTRNFIFANLDKDILIGFLYRRYAEIAHKDI